MNSNDKAMMRRLYQSVKKDSMQMAVAVLGIASLVIALCGCIPEVEKKPVNTAWPPPPAEPKIKFIEEISSGDDMKAETKSGWVKKFFGGEEDFDRRLRRPYGVAVDGNGRIYVADAGRVFVFDKKNNNLSFIGDKPGKGQLKMPIGVAVSLDGRIYVSDATSEKIFAYNSNGEFIGSIGYSGELKSPAGIAIDAVRGRLYVVDTKKNILRAYTLDGKLLFSIGDHEINKDKFSFPTNIAIDSEGNIYVVDTGNFKVRVFNPDGKPLKVIDGGRPNFLIRPKGIAIDSEDHVYIVDAALQKFFVFDKEGNLFFSVGEGGIEPGQFSVPAGIAVDTEDRIYVVDQLNGRVQVFQYLGEKWKAIQLHQKKVVAK